MNELWQEAYRTGVEYSGHALGAIAIVAVGWVGGRFLVAPFRRLLERSRVDPSVASFLANTARSALVVVVVLGVLQQLGVQTASLLTLLGAAVLAIALSLQSSLGNFASGLLVLASRMVRVGDFIEMGDLRGRVTDLLPFHIVLVTLDNQRVTIPNTLFTSSAVRNHSALPVRRVQWTLPLNARDDLTRVKGSLESRLRADERILIDPGPQLYVQEWSDEKLVLAIAAWTSTTNHLAVQQELLEILGSLLDELRRTPGGG